MGIAMSTSLSPTLALLAALAGPATTAVAAPPASSQEGTQPSAAADRRKAVEGDLRFLYTMYFAVRGCTTAARDLSKPEFLPSVSFDDVKRITANADTAARDVGIDVERAWLIAAPVGQATAEALQKDTADNLAKCKMTGSFVRSIVARLQMALTELGSNKSIIEKDF